MAECIRHVCPKCGNTVDRLECDSRPECGCTTFDSVRQLFKREFLRRHVFLP